MTLARTNDRAALFLGPVCGYVRTRRTRAHEGAERWRGEGQELYRRQSDGAGERARESGRRGAAAAEKSTSDDRALGA